MREMFRKREVSFPEQAPGILAQCLYNSGERVRAVRQDVVIRTWVVLIYIGGHVRVAVYQGTRYRRLEGD